MVESRLDNLLQSAKQEFLEMKWFIYYNKNLDTIMGVGNEPIHSKYCENKLNEIS